jgi:hypothetical protein
MNRFPKHGLLRRLRTVLAVRIFVVADLECEGKGKGKAIPVQAWRDPEVSRRMRRPHFKTIGT